MLLVQLHAPSGQIILVNPQEVTSVRAPTVTQHFAPGAHCLLFLTNRNLIAVREPCDEVGAKLTGAPPCDLPG